MSNLQNLINALCPEGVEMHLHLNMPKQKNR